MTTDYQILLEKSKSCYLPPHEIENFITKDELEFCINLYDELPVFQPASHERATRKDYLMHDEHDKRMQEMFLPKLQSINPNKKITIDGGNFTEWHQPVKIHTDGYQLGYKKIDDFVSSDAILGLAVLIPLKTDTGKGIPNTIFFDQTYFGENIDYGTLTKHKKLNEIVDNYTNAPFTASEYETELVSYMPLDNLHGFSIKKVIPWTNGNAIIWHRSQFHCAGRFKDYNSKTHLVFFINFV